LGRQVATHLGDAYDGQRVALEGLGLSHVLERVVQVPVLVFGPR
jgi:hypothetical protein